MRLYSKLLRPTNGYPIFTLRLETNGTYYAEAAAPRCSQGIDAAGLLVSGVARGTWKWDAQNREFCSSLAAGRFSYNDCQWISSTRTIWYGAPVFLNGRKANDRRFINERAGGKGGIPFLFMWHALGPPCLSTSVGALNMGIDVRVVKDFFFSFLSWTSIPIFSAPTLVLSRAAKCVPHEIGTDPALASSTLVI